MNSPTIHKPTIQIPSFLKEAILDESSIVCVKAGRRTGKTYNFALWLIIKLDGKPNSKGLWLDTKHSNIDKYITRYFQPILAKMNLWSECNYNQQKKILTLHNGSYIDFGSAERPELMEGFDYDYAVLNEGGIIFKKQSLWNNTLLPMLKNAQTRIIGTPKGNNTFKELYMRYPHYSYSAYDSPFWTEAEIEEAKSAMTQEAFRQEILAEFIEGAGAVFRNIYECSGGELLEGPADGRYVLAADLAKHQDFTVILIGDSQKKEVVYFERFNQIDWGLQKARIISAYHKFNCRQGIIDSTGVGDSIYDDLVNSGLNIEGFKFTSTTKQELVQNLSVAMDKLDITYPPIEILLDELSIYAYEQRADGRFRYSAPEGFHDDTVMALALINKLFRGQKFEFEFI